MFGRVDQRAFLSSRGCRMCEFLRERFDPSSRQSIEPRKRDSVEILVQMAVVEFLALVACSTPRFLLGR